MVAESINFQLVLQFSLPQIFQHVLLVVRLLFALTLQLVHLLLVARLSVLKRVLALVQLLLLSEVAVLELEHLLLALCNFLLQTRLDLGELLQVHQHVLVVVGHLLNREFELQFNCQVLFLLLGLLAASLVQEPFQVADLCLIAPFQSLHLVTPLLLQALLPVGKVALLLV